MPRFKKHFKGLLLIGCCALPGCSYIDFEGAERASSSSNHPSLVSSSVAPTPVEIDAGLREEFPYLWRSAMFTTEWLGTKVTDGGFEYLYEKYPKDHLPGLNTVYISMYSESFPDYKEKVEKHGLLDNAIEKATILRDLGGEALFSMQDMPSWLTSAPPGADNWWQYPPKDYSQWKELVNFIVSYLSNEAGIIGGSYRIWEEADSPSFWKGTLDEFCLLYQSSAEGILAADPQAKITFGNIGLSSKLMEKMLHDCPNVPINYYIFHPFNQAPLAQVYQGSITKFLDGGGNPNIPLHAESWQFMSKNEPLANGRIDERDHRRDTEETAAYLVNNMAAMHAAGIPYHAFFSDVDWDFARYYNNELKLISKNQQFYGDYGILTRDLVIKPSYNAFRLLSLVAGKGSQQTFTKLPASQSSDFIASMASQNSEKTTHRILVSNFVPGPDQATQYLVGSWKSCLTTKGYSAAEIESINQTFLETIENQPSRPKKVSDALTLLLDLIPTAEFPDPADGLKTQRDLLSCTTEVEAKMNQIVAAASNDAEVALTLKNLAPGLYTLTSFSVDAKHSNSCRLNKETEKKVTTTPCGVNGVVDLAVNKAKRDSKKLAKSETLRFFSRLGYSFSDARELRDQVMAIHQECRDNHVSSPQRVDFNPDELRCFNKESSKFCFSHPQDCSNLTEGHQFFEAVHSSLLYHGQYTVDGDPSSSLSIPISIDRINSDPNLFKPKAKGGSGFFEKTSPIAIPLEDTKTESVVVIGSGGLFSSRLNMAPSSLRFLELKRRR